MSLEQKPETWTDIIDKNNYFQSGLAILYRNPQIDPSLDTIIYNPSNHVYSLIPGNNYLFDQQPIAFGFTAFIGHDEIVPIESSLKSDLKNPKVAINSIAYYQTYTKIQLIRYSYYDRRNPRPKTEKQLEIDFYNELLINEANHLSKSERFFSEFQNEVDRIEKEKLRDYLDAYFEWIEDKIIDLNPNENQIKGLGGLREVEAKYIFKEFKGVYLHSKTKQEHFVAIFQNRILPDGWVRVEWLGKKAALFSFMDQVFSAKVLPKTIKKYFIVEKDFLYTRHRTITENPDIKKLLNYAKTISLRK